MKSKAIYWLIAVVLITSSIVLLGQHSKYDENPHNVKTIARLGDFKVLIEDSTGVRNQVSLSENQYLKVVEGGNMTILVSNGTFYSYGAGVDIAIFLLCAFGLFSVIGFIFELCS